jgi:hypothetical protein
MKLGIVHSALLITKHTSSYNLHLTVWNNTIAFNSVDDSRLMLCLCFPTFQSKAFISGAWGFQDPGRWCHNTALEHSEPQTSDTHPNRYRNLKSHNQEYHSTCYCHSPWQTNWFLLFWFLILSLAVFIWL